MKRVTNNENGSITVMCLVILAIALVLVAALASETVTNAMATHRDIARDQARCLAEAGLEYGICKLKADSNYTGTNGDVVYGQGTFNLVVGTNGTAKVITSVGTSKDKVTATVKVEVNSGSHMTFPDGCMAARDGVDCTGSFSTVTVPSTKHQASIRANGDITGSGSISIDGSMLAHGSVNLNGSPYVYNSPVQSGAPLMAFPDATATSAWQQQLKSQAQAGGTIAGISLTGSNTKTITAPVYINGDIKLTGSTSLTICGSGTVYVEGTIKTTGSSSITSSALVASSDVIDVSGSNSYTLTSSSPNHVGLVSFATDKSTAQPAITMTGSSSMGLNGLIYAANGGIKITGSSAFYGALIAAGGSIKATGSGVVNYPADMLKNNDIVPGGFKVQSWIEP